MDHIKNSPNLPGAQKNQRSETTRTASLDLRHPNDLAKLSPWQLDFVQLDPGPMRTLVSVRAGQISSVLGITMDRKVHQRGVCPEGWSTFGVSSARTVPTWQGQDLEDDAFLTFGNNDGFDGLSTETFVGTVVSIHAAKLEAFSEACGYRLLGDGPASRVLPSADATRRMAHLKHTIQATLSVPDAPYDAGTEEALMIDVLALLTDAEIHQDKSSARMRNRAVSRALEIMRATLDEPISIEDLCRESGSSWRTLDRAFQERFGFGPKSYYTRLRLNQVRRELLESAPSDAIAGIANRHGFWHMGQLAKDYRRLFGELPSKTLQSTVQ